VAIVGSNSRLSILATIFTICNFFYWASSWSSFLLWTMCAGAAVQRETISAQKVLREREYLVKVRDGWHEGEMEERVAKCECMEPSMVRAQR
jgi:hypothetical protein